MLRIELFVSLYFFVDDLRILVSDVFIDDLLLVFGKELLNVSHRLLALPFIHHLPNYQLKLKIHKVFNIIIFIPHQSFPLPQPPIIDSIAIE